MREFPAVQAIYKLYGAPGAIRNVHVDAPHNYNQQSREAVYAFLASHLKGEAFSPQEREVDLNPEDLLVGEPLCRECPPVFDSWRAFVRMQRKTLSPANQRDILRSAAGVEWPKQIDAIPNGDTVLLQREGTGERLPARWVPGEGSVTVLVSTKNPDAARRRKGVLVVNPFQTGVAETGRGKHRDFLTFHRSDDQNRVQDIVTGLAYAAAASRLPVKLECDRKSGAWCLLAAAIAPVKIDLVNAGNWQEDTGKSPFIPGLEWAGGMPMARRLASSGVPMAVLDIQ